MKKSKNESVNMKMADCKISGKSSVQDNLFVHGTLVQQSNKVTDDT